MIFGRGIEGSIRLSMNIVVVTVAISMSLVNFKIAFDIRDGEAIKFRESIKESIANEISTSFRAHLDDFSSLADAPILVTSLTDSEGRNNYLSQFLSQKTQASHVTFDLSDYKKRSLVRTGEIEPQVHENALLECDENITRSVSVTLSQNYLSFCGNINLPADQLPIGFLVGVIPINDFIQKSIRINQAGFIINTEFKNIYIEAIKPTDLNLYTEHDNSIVANINLEMPIDPNRITSLKNILMIGLFLALNIIIGYILSRYMARRISKPIVSLSNAALAFTAGELKEVSKDHMAIEIRSLANTLESTFSEQARIKSDLKKLVDFDHLTGALTRTHFTHSFESLLQLAKRTGDGIAVLFIDLDRFKSVNDTYGHDAGDIVLRCVVSRLQNRLRQSDLIGRRGGDEFVLGLYPARNTSEIEKVSSDVIEILSQPIQISEKRYVSIGASIGIALYPKHGETTEELILNADAALYKAKKMGGNQFVWHNNTAPLGDSTD